MDSTDNTEDTTTPEQDHQEPPERKEATDTTNEMSIEDYKQALTAARKEAAKYRTQRNELRPLAQKYQELEDKNKTEAEKQAERIQQLEAENLQMKTQALKTTIAAEHGIPIELLQGTTEEELTNHAEAIKQAIDKAVTQALEARPFAPMVPGEHPRGDSTSDTDWLRNKLRGL